MIRADKGLAHAPTTPPIKSTDPRPPGVGTFDDFFQETYPWLIKVAMAAGARLHDAEDAADEIMTNVCQRWEKITDPRAYARKAVTNYVKKVGRRDAERVARTVAGGQATPAAEHSVALTAWEDRQWVLAHLDALPPAQRDVMAGVVDGLTTVELAQALGKTTSAVRKNLQLARTRLKAELARERQRQQQTGEPVSGTPPRRKETW